MSIRRRTPRGGLRVALFLALGIALAGTAVLGFATWLNTESASAAPAPTVESTLDGDGYDVTSDTLPPGGVIPPASAMSSQTPEDPTAPREYVDNNHCLDCHGDPSLVDLMTKELPDGTSVPLYVDRAGLSHSVHRFNDCTVCHTANPHDVETPLTKLSLAEKCGSCHEYQYAQYIESVHGAPQVSGNSDPATCVDCHSATSNPHNIERVLDPSATAYPKNIAETCAKCHDDSQLMAKYGIVEKVYETYMRSFHGKAMSLENQSASLQQLDKATCVNCHGAHNIALVSDPDSPVAGMDNLAKTCQQCHEGADAEFAKGFLGHKEAEPTNIPAVYWGEKFFYVLTRTVLAGGVVLVAAPIGRKVVVDRVKRWKKTKRAEPQQETREESTPAPEHQQDEREE